MEEKSYLGKAYKFSHNEDLYYKLGFLLWPFGIALAAFRSWDKPWSKNLFWMFCVFFGFTFIIGIEDQADSTFYADLFLHYAHSRLNIRELWLTFYTDDGYVDIFSPLVIYLVSRITDNTAILFATFGMIFGYFYSRNIWYVLERVNGKISGIVIIFFLTFILLNPIWNINAFRFSVAAQIFLFGALPYLLEGKRTRLIWAVSTILIHFSFAFAVGIIFVYVVLGNRLNIYMGFFILTAFIKEIDLQIVQSALSFLPDIFYNKVMNYTNAYYIEGLEIVNESMNWYVLFSNTAVKWVIYAFVLYVYFFGRKVLRDNKDMTSILSFALLLYGASNIFSFIPSGGRYIIVSSMFMLVFIILFLNNAPQMKGLFLVKAFSLPLLSLYCLVIIRTGMDFFGIMTIVGNPLTVIFYSEHVPLISSIKSMF